MVTQCCKCYRLNVKDGGWVHIGTPEMAYEIETSDGLRIDISHGFCPDCYRTAKAQLARFNYTALLDPSRQAA